LYTLDEPLQNSRRHQDFEQYDGKGIGSHIHGHHILDQCGVFLRVRNNLFGLRGGHIGHPYVWLHESEQRLDKVLQNSLGCLHSIPVHLFAC